MSAKEAIANRLNKSIAMLTGEGDEEYGENWETMCASDIVEQAVPLLEQCQLLLEEVEDAEPVIGGAIYD